MLLIFWCSNYFWTLFSPFMQKMYTWHWHSTWFFFFFFFGLKQGNYSFSNCQMQTRKSTVMGTPKSSKEIGSVTYWKQIICAFSWILPHVFGYSKKYEQRSFLNYFLFNANAEGKTKILSSFFTSTLNATFLTYHKTMI